jgi:general secretion pathway protein D
LRLSNVPAGEVLRYICNIAGVKFKVEEFAVFIVPLSDGDDAVMITREFPVRDTFFDAVNVGTADAPAGGARARRPRTAATDTRAEDPIRKSLVDRGVQFPTGSAAIYNRATGTLTIKNTQDQVDLVEELVTIDQGETLLVRVETKLIEINQTDLDSLAFNYNLAGSYPLGVSGTQIAGGAVSTGTALLGAKGVKPADGLNSVITRREGVDSAINTSGASIVPNRLGISGTLDGNAFRALMEALSQKTSTDLMTAPAVLVNDGQQANVLVARQFFYPTSFEQADAAISTGGIVIADERIDTTTIVIPAWPSEFVARNVGVSMVVQPRITVDRQRVFLTLKPEITEFDGFINYGSAVNGLNSDFETRVITPNTINQPVFTTRTVDNAQLEIQDGYTMVLGGLIREDISTVDDKVPILGDIPIVGRLFRSKAEQAIKKNMLIFVSVRILRPDGEPYNIAAVPAVATGK